MSNAPGPKKGYKHGNARLIQFYGILPGAGDMALGVAATSVEEYMTYTVSGDKSQLEHPELFRDMMEQLFDDLKKRVEQ